MRISSIRWGVIWIGLGFIFLAINFEVMDSLVFPRLFSLWPVLLIAIGVELIFRKTKLYFLALLSPLLIAAAFILAASYQTGWGWDFDKFLRGWTWSYKGENTSEIEIPLEPEIDTLEIGLDCGGIEFDIQTVQGRVFTARSTYLTRSPFAAHSTRGNTELITYEYRDRASIGFFNIGKSLFYTDIGIPAGLPVIMEISSTDKRPDIDLSDVNLVSLDLYLKSKEATLRLGDMGENMNIPIDGKTGRMIIEAPEEMGFEFTGDAEKLDKMFEDDEFTDFAEGFRSIDFEEAGLKARVAIDARIESIVIDRE
ncbi:MAG: DUF5668 domain-containing protein [candidate division Zixibacteria bacterium]